MPSIPQSLLWISLVVLWLFVLVPMLISKRDAVRRTSDVALATRVLTSASSARLRRRGPAAGHRSDPEWRHAEAAEGDGLDEPGRAVVMVAADRATVDDEPDYLDVDVVEESGALPVGGSAHVDEPRDEPRDAEVPVVAEVAAQVAEPEEFVAPAAETDESDEPVVVAEDDRESEDEYEYVDDSDEADEADEVDEPSEADPRIAESVGAARRRRRESDTAAVVAARKYRFRTRTLTVMAVLLLTSAVAAFTWSSSMWWACGAVGVVTALYLAYLRRQTRIEEQLRRRRAQRMARSRLGVENTGDREFDVVPSRLRRPGAAVLEIDDEDPEFEHLEYVAFARHYDLPRAAGQ
ncbi:gephyrin-like molybdotransferase receptor GlpR [Mycolicibacterium vaccae]|uniref:divisome protein SepX/GlpR n=1 Tax=Mycolicibacterium vaccae TaxID=1810 RepID=UPI003CE6ADA9